METKISVKDLMMQAFLTGWELSDKSISQDEYLQSSIDVIEVLQVEPENVYAEEGLGLPDGEEVDHLDDLLRADGQWLYYGVEEENFFLIQWYPDVESANAKLAELEAMGDGSKQYLVDFSLKRVEGAMLIVVIGVRADEEVYAVARKRAVENGLVV